MTKIKIPDLRKKRKNISEMFDIFSKEVNNPLVLNSLDGIWFGRYFF